MHKADIFVLLTVTSCFCPLSGLSVISKAVGSELNYNQMSDCIINTLHGHDVCVRVCSYCRRWFSIQKNQLVYQKKHNVSIRLSNIRITQH